MKLDYTLEYSSSKENGAITMQLRLGQEVLSRWLINTREKATREALIALGWTPPPEADLGPCIRCGATIVHPPGPCIKCSREMAPPVTTANGLLWEGRKLLSATEADEVARCYGFMFAESLIQHLEAGNPLPAPFTKGVGSTRP